MKKNDRPAALRLWQVRAVLAEGEICVSVDTRKGSNSHNQALPTPKQKQQCRLFFPDTVYINLIHVTDC